jgi:hypothetical protein
MQDIPVRKRGRIRIACVIFLTAFLQDRSGDTINHHCHIGNVFRVHDEYEYVRAQLFSEKNSGNICIKNPLIRTCMDIITLIHRR